jgi:hypothetical protein
VSVRRWMAKMVGLHMQLPRGAGAFRIVVRGFAAGAETALRRSSGRPASHLSDPGDPSRIRMWSMSRSFSRSARRI